MIADQDGPNIPKTKRIPTIHLRWFRAGRFVAEPRTVAVALGGKCLRLLPNRWTGRAPSNHCGRVRLGTEQWGSQTRDQLPRTGPAASRRKSLHYLEFETQFISSIW